MDVGKQTEGKKTRKRERESCRGQLACCVCAGCREISVLLFTDGVVRQALLALLLSCVPWPLPLCQAIRLVPTSLTPPLHLPSLDFSFCFVSKLASVTFLAVCLALRGPLNCSLNDAMLWLSFYHL